MREATPFMLALGVSVAALLLAGLGGGVAVAQPPGSCDAPPAQALGEATRPEPPITLDDLVADDPEPEDLAQALAPLADDDPPAEWFEDADDDGDDDDLRRLLDQPPPPPAHDDDIDAWLASWEGGK
ncbi:MAG: hypothetical protein M9894_14575 [Planctomycetes bacterium]|nr:hypothetical protein [Planctomycetota bacterium]